jgi:chaperonin GroEL
MKKVHKERHARLQAKIAEIEVGGRTDSLKGEARDLIVDSLNSAKSAILSGMLPGGGIALYQASKVLENGLPDLIEDENEAMGVRIMADALKKPI